MQCDTLLLILVDTGLKELYLPLLVTGLHCKKLWVWKHICQYQGSWDKLYSPGCNHLCPVLQFGSKHVCIKDVHIFKHCREMTLFLLWIGTYCISCVVQQTSGVKDLSSLVRYDDSSIAAIRHVQSIIPLVRPCPNIRSHSVLFQCGPTANSVCICKFNPRRHTSTIRSSKHRRQMIKIIGPDYPPWSATNSARSFTFQPVSFGHWNVVG